MNSNEIEILETIRKIVFLMNDYRVKLRMKMEWFSLNRENNRIGEEEIQKMTNYELLKYQHEKIKKDKELIEILESLSEIFNTIENMFFKIEEIPNKHPLIKFFICENLSQWRMIM